MITNMLRLNTNRSRVSHQAQEKSLGSRNGSVPYLGSALPSGRSENVLPNPINDSLKSKNRKSSLARINSCKKIKSPESDPDAIKLTGFNDNLIDSTNHRHPPHRRLHQHSESKVNHTQVQEPDGEALAPDLDMQRQFTCGVSTFD
jgi:hypothetical protein